MEPGTPLAHPSLARLAKAESALVRTEGAASAKKYAQAVMLESALPLEAINNLVYIVKQMPEASESLGVYLEMIEGQLQRLNGIVQQTLDFCKE